MVRANRITPAVDQKFSYGFYVWPDETRQIPAAVFELFKAFSAQLELTFTPSEFDRFRAELADFGITLHEIGRTPYVEPEIVS